MQGQLFTQDFLLYGIRETEPYRALAQASLDAFVTRLRVIFQNLRADSTLNEAQTEQLLIEPMLQELGWTDATLPQVNLSGRRREDVPDILLFPNPEARAAALAEPRDDRRYRHGIAILEAKRWLRPLDRGDASDAHDPGAPSSQMLRYLSRADVMSDRAVKWGLLTNGGVWRLYWQDARSRAEEFFELDLAALLGVPGHQGELFELDAPHGMRLFFLLFHRAAFLTQTWDREGRSYHAHARNEARQYEEQVSQDLGRRVFDDIFPALSQALAAGDLQARKEPVGYGSYTRQRYTADYLDEVREAALILLYRLLFLFYAEDRRLLPVDEPGYRAYSVRQLREEVRDKTDQGARWSTTMIRLWLSLKGVFELIDVGEDTIGMPAYNGGLFARDRSLLLERTRVTDAVLAPIIDALSRRNDLLRGWINYRDLAVSHLGGIYERLLEYSLVHEVQAANSYADRELPEIDRIVARPASFARKVSGSYYTHDDLVRLVLRESVGLLARERVATFEKAVAGLKKRTALNPGDWDRLDRLDPASAILELKICDPAMGSGHFLVALVDDLADRVLEAVTAAQLLVAEQPWAAHLVETGRPWLSPVVTRCAQIRQAIKRQANEHGWRVTDAQLDDRHIVRRMVLKKSIFGVDKNLMAVELAKTALWLHTFTVGAPLSFLDHHLKHGDSLHGEQLSTVQQGLQDLGMLFQQGELDRLALAARNLAQVADYTDVDIAEARASKRLADEADAQVAPLHALLDFWRAMRWLEAGWPPERLAKLAKLGDASLQAALAELFAPTRNLVATLKHGSVEGRSTGAHAANDLLVRTRALARQESFLHWWTAFPTAFSGSNPGFDAVIGNPPWDMLQMQEVEWFAERIPAIAKQARAADRKAFIADLPNTNPEIWRQFELASERSDAEQRVVRTCGDFPLLSEGRSNLYKLFVERAQALCKTDGLVALITPTGIAADYGSALFFKSISSSGRLGCLFDFENRRQLFPDVDSRFKFCVVLFGGAKRRFDRSRFAFFLQSLADLDTTARTVALSADDISRVNPNTGALPLFRRQRDAEITLGIYARLPVLVRHRERSASLGQQPGERAWPIRYQQGQFNLTSDSRLFRDVVWLRSHRLERGEDGLWRSEEHEALPLYVGRMIHQFDHRHASVEVHAKNLHNAAQGVTVDSTSKADLHFGPTPQYWVVRSDSPSTSWPDWSLGFRDIARATDVRTFIACIVPRVAIGNTLPLLVGDGTLLKAADAACMLAMLNCFAFDYVARQKAQSTHLNWYIVEQLPVIPPARFDDPLPAAFTARMRADGLMNGHHPQPRIADFVIPQVLALSYTAHDLAPFARDLGYVDGQGKVLPPITWNDEDRRARMAALDALFFHLYGLGADDAGYVLDTFPIVRQQDEAAFGHYRTKADILSLLPLLQSPAA